MVCVWLLRYLGSYLNPVFLCPPQSSLFERFEALSRFKVKPVSFFYNPIIPAGGDSNNSNDNPLGNRYFFVKEPEIRRGAKPKRG
jgi:hypothetical protein